jgi:hypothetical protein
MHVRTGVAVRTVALLFAMASALVVAGPITAHAASQPELTAQGTVAGFSAVRAEAGESTFDDPPVEFECLWNWAAEWPAGQVVLLTYEASFVCGLGPTTAGFIQAELHLADGTFEGSGEVVNIGPEPSTTPTVSEGANIVNRPLTHFVRSVSGVSLLPDPGGTIWIWFQLPEGCEGVGTPVATCEIDFEQFTV